MTVVLMWFPVAVAVVALVGALASGKTFNPLRGLKPMFASRNEQPARYRASVIFWVCFLALSGWIAAQSISN